MPLSVFGDLGYISLEYHSIFEQSDIISQEFCNLVLFIKKIRKKILYNITWIQLHLENFFSPLTIPLLLY